MLGRTVFAPCMPSNHTPGPIHPLSSNTRRYHEEAGGVLLALSDLRLPKARPFATVMGDLPFLHLHVEATALVFAPRPGLALEGRVTKVGVCLEPVRCTQCNGASVMKGYAFLLFTPIVGPVFYPPDLSPLILFLLPLSWQTTHTHTTGGPHPRGSFGARPLQRRHRAGGHGPRVQVPPPTPRRGQRRGGLLVRACV